MSVKNYLLPVLLLLLSACSKQQNPTKCYDEELAKAAKSWSCNTSCPGVEGCDGKYYCSDCEAARKGIHIKK